MSDGDKKGHFVSYLLGALVGLLALGALVGVGLLVWYKAPRMECTVRTNETNCQLYAQRYGKKSICNAPDYIPEPEKVKEEERVTGLRLNTSVIPYHYDIELWPILSGDFGLNGSVDIRVSVREQSDVIVLQVDDLTVHNDTIDIRNLAAPSMQLPVSHTEHDPARHFYKIYLATPLNQGRNYSVKMTFNASLIHPDWRGFYRSSYVENGKTKWMASTQFQRSHARRAFPCFDEPSFKATFKVTLVRLYNFTTISNMPLVQTTVRPGTTEWVNDEYPTSVVMPTYLVAFVVSQFDHRDATGPKGLPIKVWSRPTFINYTKYALKYSGDFINAFEEWTDIAYALPKLDQIAVPDFAAGAMENWGLVTYRESALLYDPAYSDNTDMRWVASVIAHELAHMWFGNLVTCAWWGDTWLNEGFATYFGDLVAMQKVMPEYKMDEFFIRRVMHIMRKDGLKSSQPVYVAGLEHHDDLLKAFDIITYYKGGSILRMMQYFLTEETFRRGIQEYLKKHQFSNTVHEDLYQELQKVAKRQGTVTWDESKTNLSGIMDTWIEQMNYPLVNVSDPENGKVTVTQTRFLYDKGEDEEESKEESEEEVEKEYFWHIPLTYATPTDVKNGRSHLKWIHSTSEQIEIPNLGANDWLLVNFRLQGYYRVRYGQRTWDAIIRQLNTNHTVFPVENRAEFIGDAFQLAAAKELSEVEALRTTQYLTKETEYLPFSEYRVRTEYYLDMFYGKPLYDELEIYLRNLILPAYNASGWAVNHTTDPHLDRYIRMIAITQACSLNYKPCVDEAKAMFAQFMNTPDHDPTPPDLREVVYCTAVSRGGNAEWDFLLSQYKRNLGDVYTAYYNSTLKDALSCATATHVVRKYLEYSLSKNDTGSFAVLASKREARDTVWNYITENWDRFVDGNETRISRPAILSAVTRSWNSEGDMRKLESFKASHTDQALDKTYKAIKKTITKNMEWLDNNLGPLEDWLVSVNSNNSADSDTGSQHGTGRRRRSLSTDIDPVRSAFHQLRAEF